MSIAIAMVSGVAWWLITMAWFPDVLAKYGTVPGNFAFGVALFISLPVTGTFFTLTQRLGRLNATLADQVNRDSLTGLMVRAAFRDSIREHRKNLQASGSHGDALLLIDIDHFKSVNDTFGHAAGDQVLRMIGYCISGNSFDRDYVARLGGEEFAVYLKNCGPNGAVAAAERIRAAIEDCRAHHEGRSIRVTASVGSALMPEGMSYETAFKLSDFALYRAKAAGRNRCEFNGLPGPRAEAEASNKDYGDSSAA